MLKPLESGLDAHALAMQVAAQGSRQGTRARDGLVLMGLGTSANFALAMLAAARPPTGGRPVATKLGGHRRGLRGSFGIARPLVALRW